MKSERECNNLYKSKIETHQSSGVSPTNVWLSSGTIGWTNIHTKCRLERHQYSDHDRDHTTTTVTTDSTASVLDKGKGSDCSPISRDWHCPSFRRGRHASFALTVLVAAVGCLWLSYQTLPVYIPWGSNTNTMRIHITHCMKWWLVGVNNKHTHTQTKSTKNRPKCRSIFQTHATTMRDAKNGIKNR